MTAHRRPSGPGPPTLQQRLANALNRKPSRKHIAAAPPATIPSDDTASDDDVDCGKAFQSPLFHYASKSHLPLLASQAQPPLPPPSATTLAVRSRAATLGASHLPPRLVAVEPLRNAAPSAAASTSPKSRPPLTLSREASSRRRALSQPTRADGLQRKQSTVTSTPRGAPRDWAAEEAAEEDDVIDMRSDASAPFHPQGHPGRQRGTISPDNVVAPQHTVSPLYAVFAPDAPLGRAEPRNAAYLSPTLSPDRARAIAADRRRGATSPSPSASASSSRPDVWTEVISNGKPIASRVMTDSRAARNDSTAIRRPTERPIDIVEDQLEQLRTHLTPTRQMSGGSDGIELRYAATRHRPRSDRGGEASESAETLLSLIRQNRGSTQTVSTHLSASGLSRTASQTRSDSILENGESHESGTDSIGSTLESFSLHTISKPISPPVQRGDLNRAQLAQIQHFKSAYAQYNEALANHTLSQDSSAPSAPSRVNSNVFSPAQSRSSGKLKESLDEADIEIVEEEPIHREQTTLIGIRRKLVEHYDDLGRRSGRLLSTKSNANMSRTATEQSAGSSHRPWDFVSEKEKRKREEDLEAREKDLTIEALSKAEMATVRIEIWTESRKGKWIIRGPAENDGYPPDELPLINDPWSIPIDSKGIVRRKKLKSNVELSSTRTVVECPHCAEGLQMGLQVQCRTCDNSFRVEMVYTVQCVVRLASFLPLKLPAVLLLGTKQPHIKYIDSTDPGQIVDILRDRAMDGLQSAAERVVKAHHAQHGSKLLMGRATITRRGMLSVSVTSSKTKTKRHFDVEDGADGKIVEVKISPTRSQSTPAPRAMVNDTAPNTASAIPIRATAANVRKKLSLAPLSFSDRTSVSSSSSLASPPPFGNFVAKVSKGQAVPPTHITAKALSNKTPTVSSEQAPMLSDLKPRKSIRNIFYR